MIVCVLGDYKNKDVASIREYLGNTGHKVFTVEVKGNDEAFLTRFKESQKTISASDIVIAHSSIFDIAQSFQLALSLEVRRHTLLLVPVGDKRSKVLEGQDSGLHIKYYSDTKGIRTGINTFTDEMMNKLDAKMFMIIPPTVNKYLDWIVNYTDRSKSDVVRRAVEDVADQDVDYQAFLSKAT
ncbi:hypothetical protein COX05_04040 [candidate division WWE3 bacterium CG22_combo_CG10-13_8_21_14_all_39_12]|uniref:Uncharacterized protein n=2 Tax=Katanobacteria TaxID=422282 RepID=A0A2M7X4U5_UNCKA|nr:MAG: hypothetical protein COX05_04040 [candidate division WWE3 bacterium CG22_combo_CG10-13_8_21_14_all_39_12]PJA41139.1 MAG: hypothetical protein CO179_00545 [candidate division WWE3 bacterium CG_4_9_14_3_um_filter_39_7]